MPVKSSSTPSSANPQPGLTDKQWGQMSNTKLAALNNSTKLILQRLETL